MECRSLKADRKSCDCCTLLLSVAAECCLGTAAEYNYCGECSAEHHRGGLLMLDLQDVLLSIAAKWC